MDTQARRALMRSTLTCLRDLGPELKAAALADLKAAAPVSRFGDLPTLAELVTALARELADAEQAEAVRAIPLALGDEVTVVATASHYRPGETRREKLVKVGREYVSTDLGRYARDDGHGAYNWRLVRDDVVRVNRCFDGKGAPKGT